jgi:hypothetical protein
MSADHGLAKGFYVVELSTGTRIVEHIREGIAYNHLISKVLEGPFEDLFIAGKVAKSGAQVAFDRLVEIQNGR